MWNTETLQNSVMQQIISCSQISAFQEQQNYADKTFVKCDHVWKRQAQWIDMRNVTAQLNIAV